MEKKNQTLLRSFSNGIRFGKFFTQQIPPQELRKLSAFSKTKWIRTLKKAIRKSCPCYTCPSSKKLCEDGNTSYLEAGKKNQVQVLRLDLKSRSFFICVYFSVYISEQSSMTPTARIIPTGWTTEAVRSGGPLPLPPLLNLLVDRPDRKLIQGFD